MTGRKVFLPNDPDDRLMPAVVDAIVDGYAQSDRWTLQNATEQNVRVWNTFLTCVGIWKDQPHITPDTIVASLKDAVNGNTYG